MDALAPLVVLAAIFLPLYLWFWVRALANLVGVLVRGH